MLRIESKLVFDSADQQPQQQDTTSRPTRETNSSKLDQLLSCMREWNGGTSTTLNSTILVPRPSPTTEGDNSATSATAEAELYDELNRQWNLRKLIIQPLAILVPDSAEHVQAAVSCGHKLGLRLVPKSGGHSLEKYSFGDSNSVVIDLRNLSSVVVNASEETARVGAGALIASVYWELWAQGKFGLPAPTCVSVGISGAALGGGQGIWTKRFGLTLDRILEMEVVDYRGNLLTVNQLSHPDLFWALRGAGANNFGIVTSFKFKLFPAGHLRTFLVSFAYKVDMFEEAFKAWQVWTYEHRDGPAYTRFEARASGLRVLIIDAGLSPEDIAGIRRSFPPANGNGDLPVAASIEEMNYIEMQARMAIPSVLPWRPSDLSTISRTNYTANPYAFRGKSFLATRKLLTDAEILRLSQSRVMTQVPAGCFVGLESWGGVMNQVGRNETAFVHRDSLYNAFVLAGFDNERTVRWVNEFANLERIWGVGKVYQNFVDGELGVSKDDFMERYYGENQDKLKVLKRHYDPTNYFNYEQSIPISNSKI